MIKVEKIYEILDEMIATRDYSISNWDESRFEMMKKASTTDKGNIGEDLVERLLVDIGYEDVDREHSRRGHWDVRVKNGLVDIKFEVKVATQDVHGHHQFNGVRYDTKYTHLFLLGVCPETLHYKIVEKKDLIGGKYTLASMARGSNATYKLTQKTEALKSFSEFEKEIINLLGNPTADGGAILK